MALETLNNRALSWAELTCTVNVQGGVSLPQIDIKSIDHETKVERGVQRGIGGRIRKRTTGQGDNSASASFYRDGLRDLKKELVKYAPQNSDGHYQLSKVTFDLVIKHSFDDDPEIHETRILGCHLDKDAGKHAEGTDPEAVDVDLNPIKIVEIVDGKETVLL